MKQYSFSKEKRLCSNRLFVSILKNGKCVRNRLLTIYIAPTPTASFAKLTSGGGFSRLGISIGKSYGNAVERNRIKRLVREVFRLNQYKIPSGYDYLVLIKKKIDQPSYGEIKKAFLSLLSSLMKSG